MVAYTHLKEGDSMSDQTNDKELHEPKKVSLADAIKNKLNQKKQNQAAEKANPKLKAENVKARSQQTKKSNNQRRRTGV
jgi:ribonuclease I